ncbi:SlyX family protein [uncultured Ramlibacter sp.]|uniref:SlyX family protein n=1 Tax=uncultured Ramlibacter sp. TaxID=260755 RepID=UPI00261AA9E5|nr:SlyX family protein [uncultured Ramlibacter sp.]
MSTPDRIDQRLTDLEIKASFTEDLVEQLNQVVIRQQEQIDVLVRELGALRQQQRDSGGADMGHPRDERPPHY